jgi:DNA-directed RNA polymerase
MSNDHSSLTDATESLTTIDLDEITRAQQTMKTDLQQEIKAMQQATMVMQQQLKMEFEMAMQQLELCMETNTNWMIQSPGESLHQAVAQQVDSINSNIQENNAYLLQAITEQISNITPQPGGVAQMVLRKLTGRVSSHGRDELG